MELHAQKQCTNDIVCIVKTNPIITCYKNAKLKKILKIGIEMLCVENHHILEEEKIHGFML